jgi:hypothetical protein
VSRKGDRTLSGILADLERRGFVERFEPAGEWLRAAPSGRAFRADELTIREVHRFEGVSDPDDMSVIYAIESRDGTRGTLVDAFGVYANPEVGAILAGVPIHRPRAS